MLLNSSTEVSGIMNLIWRHSIYLTCLAVNVYQNFFHIIHVHDKIFSFYIYFPYLKMICLFTDDCLSGIYFYCTAWTGGNDLDIEGQFVWGHSNTSMVFTNWYVTEPSIGNPSLAAVRDCIDILRNGKWNDKSCLISTAFICERTII